MPAIGDVYVRATTGERAEVVTLSPELLEMRVTWPRPGHRVPEHLHPGMEETWRVVSGRATFVVDGVRAEGGPGTVVTAPKGRRHLAWNAGDEPVVVVIEMRPALRWAEFTQRFFAGEDPVALLAEFPDEVALPRG